MRLGFVGDIQLGAYGPRADSGPDDRGPFVHVQERLRSFDLLVGNLECCFVDDRCPAWVADSRFAVSPKTAAFLQAAGFHAMNLANNHILDCTARALQATTETLERAGIGYFGAGRNLAQAGAIHTACVDGRRVALLGACDRSAYAAGPSRPGVLPVTSGALRRLVAQAAAEADLVVVTLHADLEFRRAPAPWRRRLCRRLIDCGAHLVICHHPHVLQGTESYRNGIIAYSLGNFVFRIDGNAYQEHHEGTRDAVILGVDVDWSDSGPRFSLERIPCRIGSDHRPVELGGREAQERSTTMHALDARLGDRGVLRRDWLAACQGEARRAVWGAYYAIRRGHYSDALQALTSVVGVAENRRWVVGLLTGGLR